MSNLYPPSHVMDSSEFPVYRTKFYWVGGCTVWWMYDVTWWDDQDVITASDLLRKTPLYAWKAPVDRGQRTTYRHQIADAGESSMDENKFMMRKKT